MRKCRTLSRFKTAMKAIRQFSSPKETHLILFSCLWRCLSHAERMRVFVCLNAWHSALGTGPIVSSVRITQWKRFKASQAHLQHKSLFRKVDSVIILSSEMPSIDYICTKQSLNALQYVQ